MHRIFLPPHYQEKCSLPAARRARICFWSQKGRTADQQQLNECSYQICNGWLVFKLKISNSRCWTKCILSAAICCADAHGGIEIWATVRLTALAMKLRCAWTHCHPPYRYSGLTACLYRGKLPALRSAAHFTVDWLPGYLSALRQLQRLCSLVC